MCALMRECARLQVRQHFVMTTVGPQGNVLPQLGDLFTAWFQDEDEEVFKVDIESKNDGVYTFVYTLTQPGSYTMIVQCYHRPVPMGPFAIKCLTDAEVAKRVLNRELKPTMCISVPQTFRISTADLSQNHIHGLTADVFAATFENFLPAHDVTIVMTSPGEYLLTYTLTTVEVHALSVFCYGRHIPGSPFTIVACERFAVGKHGFPYTGYRMLSLTELVRPEVHNQFLTQYRADVDSPAFALPLLELMQLCNGYA